MPKCEAANGCTNDAAWRVAGRLVKPHVCCDDCKRAWREMPFLQTKGDVTFKRLTETKA